MKCLRLQLDSCLGSRIRRPNTPPSKNAPDATPAPVLLKISWPSQLHQLATQSSKQTTEGTERGTHLRRANEAGAPAPVPNPPRLRVPVQPAPPGGRPAAPAGGRPPPPPPPGGHDTTVRRGPQQMKRNGVGCVCIVGGCLGWARGASGAADGSWFGRAG
jgi:hypothetical protein